MPGKRPRPLQRTMSKMQLTPDDVSLGLPAIEPLQEKPIQISPNSGLPRQIIGFNPVSRDHFETVSSPRSVLSGAGSGCSQVKSPRSPRSGLGSLLYGAGFREDKGFESVGLGIVATLNNAIAEENRCRNRAMELPNIAKELLPSPKQSEPIPIGISSSGCATPSWKKTIQSEIMSSCNDSLQINSPAWSCRGLQACSNETSAFGALSDAEMEICDSIFSTASPVSSCSETWSVSVLEINFLNACYFCKRHLGPGKDIYMYRGDKAFCSTECRYQQIMLDERKERCSASVPSTTVKHHGRLLTTTTPAAA